jgi:hypothetical protein
MFISDILISPGRLTNAGRRVIPACSLEENMKLNTLALSILVLGASVATSASANTIVTVDAHSFTVSPSSGVSYAQCVYHYPTRGSIANGCTVGVDVYAGIPHLPSSGAGFRVWVDGYNLFAVGTGTRMWVTSQDTSGVVLATKTLDAPTAVGLWEREFDFTEAQVPMWAYLSAHVYLPPSQNNIVTGFAVQ